MHEQPQATGLYVTLMTRRLQLRRAQRGVSSYQAEEYSKQSRCGMGLVDTYYFVPGYAMRLNLVAYYAEAKGG
jgi:hypothetical protein